MYPHRIRLRGPWECEPLASKTATPPPPGCRCTLPCRWRAALGEFAGRVRFRRSFGFPAQLQPGERVWLHFAGLDGVADVSLNGAPLGRHDGVAGPFEVAVTPFLQPRNQLVVEIEAGVEGGLWGEVALLVRQTAYFGPIRGRVLGRRLEVVGTVRGTAETPLEFYVLLDGATVHYQPITLDGPTTAFHVQCHVEGEPAGQLRVELTGGAVVWDRVDSTVAM